MMSSIPLPPPPPPMPPARANPPQSDMDMDNIILELQMEREKLNEDMRDSIRYRNMGLFLFLIFCIFMVIGRRPDYPPQTYYQFSARWPASDCIMNTSTCNSHLAVQNRWIIGGFIPMHTNKTCSTYCNKSLFNESEVATIESELRSSWPNTVLRGQSEVTLWAAEWNKHGTCSRLNQFAYFARVLSLHSCHKFDQWLAQADITPTTSRPYTEEAVKKAIAAHLNQKEGFTLHCEEHYGNLFLTEISLCVSFNDGQTVIPCTAAMDSRTCTQDFYYANFK